MPSRPRLLTALRKYQPGADRDPVENFVTEAFAWLLKSHPGFSHYFIGQITERLKMPTLEAGTVINWSTQVNLRGKLPDLVGLGGATAFIFEHKVWSNLHGEQLANYRSLAGQVYGANGYKLILITATPQQHAQDPDLALCWRDVHRWIGDWMSHPDYQPDFFFEDFRCLLEDEGLGPPAPVSHESILAFLPAQGFEAKLYRLAEAVSKHDWAALLPAGQGKVEFAPLAWGRLGFYLTGRNEEGWCPGLYAGFLLDPDDHSITWMNPAVPDFTVIISIHPQRHPGYESLPLYQQMVAELTTAVEASGTGFQFHHQLYESTHPKGPNRWHPIHIRKPMLELLRGTVTAEDQTRRVVEELSLIVALIHECRPFWELRAFLSSQKLPPPLLPPQQS